jgi:hypothetical protein
MMNGNAACEAHGYPAKAGAGAGTLPSLMGQFSDFCWGEYRVLLLYCTGSYFTIQYSTNTVLYKGTVLQF